MLRRILILAALVAAAGAARAETARIVNENLFVDDSEDATQRAHYLGVVIHPSLRGAPDKLAFGYENWLLKDPSGREDFDILRLTYESPLTEASSVGVRLALLDGDDWSPLLGGITFIHTPADARWRFEAGAERELIDSVSGIRQELKSDSLNLSADWNITPQFAAVGALVHMSIDDGNERSGGVFRLVWKPPGFEGLSLQTRSRLLDSEFDGIGYFSPPELAEHQLLVGYARSFARERWHGTALLGGGRQHFEDDSGSATRNDLYTVELKLRGWFTDHAGLESRAWCSNTGGPSDGAPDDDYRYCSVLLSLLYSW